MQMLWAHCISRISGMDKKMFQSFRRYCLYFHFNNSCSRAFNIIFDMDTKIKKNVPFQRRHFIEGDYGKTQTAFFQRLICKVAIQDIQNKLIFTKRGFDKRNTRGTLWKLQKKSFLGSSKKSSRIIL